MRKGLTLIEVMIAAAFLAIAAAGLGSAQITMARQNMFESELRFVNNAIEGKMAEIRMYSRINYTEVVAGDTTIYSNIDGMIKWYTSSEKPANPLFGLDTLPVSFDPLDGESSVGEIIVYLIEEYDVDTGTGGVPVELGGDLSQNGYTTSEGWKFGSLDLDLDGNTNDDFTSPVDEQYGLKMVPVEIRVSWKSAIGNMTLRRFMMISRITLD